jgi:glycosyltransferase involved in cell wall biosynthesis
VVVPRNLYRNRGVLLAIEAYARCRGELDGARLLVVGGAGEAGYLEQCQARCAALDLGEAVVFAGAIPWMQMPGVYSVSDLAVIPTLCGEGTSLAALEAMSCGTATVSTHVAGLADLPTAQAAPTPEALAAALVSTWRDRAGVSVRQRDVVRGQHNLGLWQDFWVSLLASAS